MEVTVIKRTLIGVFTDFITNEVLRHSIDMHPADITKLLHRLRSNNLLKSFGFGRGMKYFVNEDYQDNHKPDERVDERVNVNVDVDVNVDDKVDVNDDDKVDVNDDDKVDVNDDDKVDVNDDDKATRGKSIIIKELTDFCKIWRNKSAMARHVGKSVGYISSHIIPIMVSDGLLEREFPDSPRNPRQRYRTSKKAL